VCNRLAEFVERAAVVGDAGICDNDVETAETIDSAVYRSVERIEIPHVDFGGHDASTEPLDKVSGFSQIVRIRRRDRIVDAYGFAHVDCDDVGTLLRRRKAWLRPVRVPHP